MSIEVDHNKYMHEPDQEPEPASEESDSNDEEKWHTQIDTINASRKKRKNANDDDLAITLPSLVPPTTCSASDDILDIVPFKHNPLHDLESLFWLGVYILFVGCLVKEGATSQTELANQTIAQNRLAARLFRDPAIRTSSVLKPNIFRKESGKAGLNPRVQKVADQLHEILKAIVAAFVDAEKDLSVAISFDVAKRLKVYDTIRKCLATAGTLLNTCDITVAIDEVSVRRFKEAALIAIPEDPIPPSDSDSDSDNDPEALSHPAKRRKTNQAGSSALPSRAANATTRKSTRSMRAPCPSAPQN